MDESLKTIRDSGGEQVKTEIFYTDPVWAIVVSDDAEQIRKIQELAEEHPDEVVIICEPKDNDGKITARFPPRWITINPPRRR